MGERVLAVHPGALGDVILLARFLASLGRPISFITGRAKGELLRQLAAADAVLEFDALPMADCFGEGSVDRLAAALPRAEWLVSCFAAGDDAALHRLGRACGARRVTGLAVRPPEDWPGHLIELWAEAMGAAVRPGDLPTWPATPALRKAGQDAADRAGLDVESPFVLIAPGAGAARKCWPIERWCELADRLGPDRPTVAVLGPVEQEAWPAEIIHRLASHAKVIVPPGLDALAGLIGLAEVFIGNDSGPAHLAAALDRPTVVLFGPTNPTHFAPQGQAVRVVTAAEGESMETIDINGVVGELP